MKKSLSLLLAIAMVFGAFASFASAAEPATAQEKFDALKAKGIFTGVNANGDAGLDQKMTRAQFARVLGLLKGLNVDAEPTVQTFTDVPKSHWAYQEVEAAAAAGLLVGVGGGKFDPNGNVTVQQVAVAVVAALGLKPVEGAKIDGAADWAADDIQALINAGINLPTNYTADATREVLVVSAYAADQVLNPSELKVSKVAQSGAKKIKVDFTRAVTAAEQKDAKFELNNGLVNYPVTAKFAEDGKAAELEASFLPAADYTLKVNAFDPVPVKIEAEKVSKVEIGATYLQKATNQAIDAKALNQFGEEVENALNDSNISVFSGVYGVKTVTAGKVDLSMEAIDTTIVVTVTHPATGVSATKNFKVTAASAATSITLGPVVPKKDTTRIAVSQTGLVLPYTLKDQNGQAIKLQATAPVGGAPANTVVISGLTFVSSNSAIVDVNTFEVDADGVLHFNTGTTDGTVVITAYSASTGATNTTTIVVNPAPALKKFQITNPGKPIVAGEKLVFPYTATDNYDAPLAKGDVPSSAAAQAAGFITSANSGIAVTKNWKANGDLELSFNNPGTTTIFVWVNGVPVSQLGIEVKPAAESVAIKGVKDVKTTMALNASQPLSISNLNIQDNYGRISSALSAGKTLVVVEQTAGGGAISYNGTNVTANAAGTETITFGIDGADADTDADAGTIFKVTFTVVSLDKVTSFTIDSIGTIKADLTTRNNGANTNWDKAVKVVGKTAEGVEVAIRQVDFVTQVTSSDLTVANIDSTSNAVYGVAKGTATVAAWNGGKKIAEATVTVSDAASVLTELKFSQETADIAIGSSTVNVSGLLVAKDQYGVNITPAGKYYSSKTDVAIVNDTTGVVTEASGTVDGQAVITFVASNGMSATITVDVDN